MNITQQLRHSWLLWCACLLIGVCMAGCRSSSYHTTNKEYRKHAKSLTKLLRQYPLRDSAGLDYARDWVGTTNFSLRRPNAVVIHHTAQGSCGETLQTFTLRRTQVSAHYVICRDGTVYHMLHDQLRAHHAGVSRWGNFTDINSSSIGIEIDNNGFEPFTELQMQSLLSLLGRLKRAYNIPTGNFIGHADVAPGRKVDPNRHFPWQRLADEGFGYWYDTTGRRVPEGFDERLALRLIGYNTDNFPAAVQSFKLHYNPMDSSLTISPPERKILLSLVERYR